MVIMSRSKERLQNVAVEIGELSPSFIHIQFSLIHYNILLSEKKYGRDIRVISVDFSKGLRNFSKLAEQLQGLDVGILGMLMNIV